jgi:hypothetical protein
LNLLLAVTLASTACLVMNPERVSASVSVVASWRLQSWTASDGDALNIGTALLSTNTTAPFYTGTGAPPGESNVFISSGWDNGSGTKYWKVAFNASNYTGLTISSQQKSSELGLGGWDGPRDFKLQYSLNDSTWIDVPGGTLTLDGSWVAGGVLNNLSLPAALDKQPSVYLRWIMTSNTPVGPNGMSADAQSDIGGIYIRGTSTIYPTITGGNNSYGDYFTNVTFAGINHNSGQESGAYAYADYTAFSGSVSRSSSPTLTSTLMVSDGANYPAIVVAWIDWNQNLSFDDAGEKYVIGTNLNAVNPNTASAAISVPAGATLGATRMRIVSNADTGMVEPPNSGSTTFYGEAEDYTINVTAATAVTLNSFHAGPAEGSWPGLSTVLILAVLGLAGYVLRRWVVARA